MTDTKDQSDESDFGQELKAMETVAKAIQVLNPESQKRVLQWVAARFVIPNTSAENPRRGVGSVNLRNVGSANDVFASGDAPSPESAYPDIASLFDAANPKTNNNKALVGGYWAQECQNNPDFAAQQINTDLKNLGHGVPNITDAFNALISQKLVMQVRKSGTTKQARKKYRLTREGLKQVQQMLNGTEEN